MTSPSSPTATLTFESRIGWLGVTADVSAVTEVKFEASPEMEREGAPAAMARCQEARREIEAYLAGEIQEFAATVEARGSEFHRAVWTAMCEIPYGEVITYGELARRVGQADAAQAVGTACGANPIPLIIPCHRIVAAGGQLGGFGGGVDLKRWLLDLEQGQQRLI